MDYGFLLFVDDVVKQTADGVVHKRWLQAGHRVEGNTHAPDVAALVVALVSDYFRRH